MRSQESENRVVGILSEIRQAIQDAKAANSAGMKKALLRLVDCVEELAKE